MKITISDLKSKLADLSTLYKEYKIASTVEVKDSETDSDYLFVEDKLLPLNSQQNLFIALKLLDTLEDSADKDFLSEKIESFKELIAKDMTVEDLENTVVAKESVQEEATSVVEAEGQTPKVVEEVAADVISKSELLAAIGDLSAKIESIQTSVVSLQDSATVSATSLQKQEIDALRRDLNIKGSLITELQSKLKSAIIDNALFKIKDAAKKEAFKEKVADKSLAEIQVAIELIDSLQEESAPVEHKAEVDTEIKQVPVEIAIEDSNQNSEIDEQEKLMLELFDSASSFAKNDVIPHKDFVEIFRDTVTNHGYSLAKELSKKIKQKYTIQ